MRASLGLLADVVRASRSHYVIYVGFLLAFGLAQLVPAYVFREIASFLLAPQGRSSFSVLVVLAGLCGAALFALGYASTAMGERTRLGTEAWLRTRVLERVSQKNLSELEAKPRGDFLSRVTQDLMEVEIFLSEDLPNYTKQAAVLLGTSLLFISHSGWASGPAFLTALLLAGISLHQHRKLIPLFRSLRKKDSQVVQGLIEGFEGQRTLRSLGAQGFFKREFDNRVEAVRMLGLQASHTYALGVATGNGLSQWLMILCLGWYAILFAEGAVSREDALVYPFFLGLFYSAVQTLAASIYRWNRFFVEGARIADLIYASDERPAAEPESFSAPLRQTTISDLKIRFPGGKVIGPVGVTLERGRLAVLCGRSGSGKSTVLETLAGLRAPESVTGFLPAPSDVAYVEQVPYLFSGSLRSNITMGKKVPDEILVSFIRLLALESTVKEHGGLDAPLADQGSGLSEGERYRVALARALVLDRPVLLLDEPFAALENELVDKICDYLSLEKENRAILIATHWVPASLDVDRRVDVESRRLSPRPEPIRIAELQTL